MRTEQREDEHGGVVELERRIAAPPETVFQFFTERGLQLRQLRTCGGSMGCNQFVFEAPERSLRMAARTGDAGAGRAGGA